MYSLSPLNIGHEDQEGHSAAGRGLGVGLSPLLRAVGHDVLLMEAEGNEC